MNGDGGGTLITLCTDYKKARRDMHAFLGNPIGGVLGQHICHVICAYLIYLLGFCLLVHVYWMNGEAGKSAEGNPTGRYTSIEISLDGRARSSLVSPE